ncbi:putative aminotransferase class IV [Medicago truncatula]|uniref:Putative aminotransferase class IV n=1 Tax=Medicago truncatula TaxID=3880 RepID=A0A396JKS3_MEDTR|nr:putative aminotransferase class IV [Medicago truncatula]
MPGSRFLFSNGILSQTLDVPPVKLFLEANPGAYTTSRTHNNASCLLFWERHMKRLSESIRILSNLAPQLLFKSNNAASLLPLAPNFQVSPPALQMLVNDSVGKVLPIALKERVNSKELAITTLVGGNLEELNIYYKTMSDENMSKSFDVHVHIETYVSPRFGIRGNGAHLAVAGYGRNVAAAKYSDWVRIRKTLEKLRPPSVTELLLSYNGDQILEGCVTNFFVVCRKNFLVCRNEGIPFREVSPSWSEHETWEEAFITNSLRLLQHVDSIQVPTEWHSAHFKTWKDISWTKKQFQGGPGFITTLIQEKVMEKAILEGCPINNICTR